MALTIAGSDSGAGAGLQADLRAMAALGVLATTAVTTVTAQNTAEVRAVHAVPVSMVTAQILTVLDDLPVMAVKSGLLGEVEVIEVVGGLAATGRLPRLVVDPVMVASTGRPLLGEGGLAAYRTALLPHAHLVTPNLWEAALLADMPVAELTGGTAMTEAARRIHGLGPDWVLVKGGHLPGVGENRGEGAPNRVSDVLFDGEEVSLIGGPHVVTANTHGTGCTLSAAITAHLARGADLPDAVTEAKAFVTNALLGAAGWRLGRGHGPLDTLGWSPGQTGGDTGEGRGG